MFSQLSAAVQWQMIMDACMLGSLQHPLLASKIDSYHLVKSAVSSADIASHMDLTS